LIQNGTLQDMSLYDCYALCGFRPSTAEDFGAFAALVDVEWGELGEITSCVNSAQWVAYSYYGDDADNTANFVTDPRGVSEVARYVLRKRGINLSTDSRIHLNTQVTNIDTTNNIITARRGGQTKKYQCNIIINTISVGALAASLRAKTNLVTPLPSINVQASLQKYHMANYRKIFLQYRTKFWGNKAHFLTTNNDPGLLITSWTSVDYPTYYPGSKILLASHNGPDSNRFSNLDDVTMVKRLADELVRVFGPAAAFSEITAYDVGDAFLDPLLLGGYSNRPPTITAADFREMWAPVRGHYIPSGEGACDALNGYIVGAYLIGISAAQRGLVNLGILSASVNPEDNECFRPPAGWEP